MNEINELVLLYDFYGELLSDTQSKYFEDYYFNNLSLSEIADNYEVSRNAVHKQIKTAIDKMNDLESKLKIIEKNNEIKNVIDSLEENVKNKITDILDK